MPIGRFTHQDFSSSTCFLNSSRLSPEPIGADRDPLEAVTEGGADGDLSAVSVLFVGGALEKLERIWDWEILTVWRADREGIEELMLH